MKGDEGREIHDAKQVNRWFQETAFGTLTLPLYVILELLPDGKVKVVDRYDKGRIIDETVFAVPGVAFSSSAGVRVVKSTACWRSKG